MFRNSSRNNFSEDRNHLTVGVLVVALLPFMALFPQQQPAAGVPAQAPGLATPTTVAPTTVAPTTVAPTTPGTTADLNGFGGIEWKSGFSSVKNHLNNLSLSADSAEKVAIMNIVENDYILIKRNDILYRYSFYKTPLEIVKVDNHNISQDEYEETEALLYHIKVTTSQLDSAWVRKKIASNFGAPSKSLIDEDLSGADIWELNGGFIFLWQEPLNKKAFSRNIDYLSQEMAETIMEEYEIYFGSRERYLLKKLQTN